MARILFFVGETLPDNGKIPLQRGLRLA